MADLDSIGVPPDGEELELPDPIPAEGVDARCRAIEIVEGPQLGVLAVITEGSAGATRTWTHVGPGWEHACQLVRSNT
ncbi:hypothetical protein WMF27_11410 [Sorangium sp. So ce281]|uniref:hypothetical protein n=1 Tax=unclassified Sorangium TaxID=2621164 RepID=UPI003F5F20D9